jgi:hypothetical protein
VLYDRLWPVSTVAQQPGTDDLQAQGNLGAHLAREPFALPHQTEQVTTNGDNKSKPPNITDTHHNHILYTSTIPQTQTSELDYIIHDNKREHTTAIFKTTNQNNTINQNHRRQHGEKDAQKGRTGL